MCHSFTLFKAFKFQTIQALKHRGRVLNQAVTTLIESPKPGSARMDKAEVQSDPTEVKGSSLCNRKPTLVTARWNAVRSVDHRQDSEIFRIHLE